MIELAEYHKMDAKSAADFFQRCQHHTHFGLYDCGDKYVIYCTRDSELAELFRLTLPVEWTTSVGQATDGYASACIVYNYARAIAHDRVSELLQEVIRARTTNKD